MVVKTFMDMDQDSEEEKELYLNLALHLASDFFLKHPDKDVRLLVACCLADIFRIYAPEAPYTSPDKLKVPPARSRLFGPVCHFAALPRRRSGARRVLLSVGPALVSRTSSCSSRDS